MPAASAGPRWNRLAENLSDGVVAPLFWGVVAGLPGILAYKAINTLDSMVGHRSDRYLDFGWASARCDDLVNLAPARSPAPCSASPAAAAGPCGPCCATPAGIARRTPAGPRPRWLRHWGCASPARAPMAGVMVDDAWMGDGRAEVTPADIRRAVALAWRVWWLLVASVAAAALIAWSR